ncbi:MAG: hypothetical protein BWX47_01757 [candidate division Hyd24-12 bacterium ADurb.Bin004]|nr:MAG: hypothetical protein BWX47_01757 [candidate division Hyd24-12 bacterium ADurb.Bin004]
MITSRTTFGEMVTDRIPAPLCEKKGIAGRESAAASAIPAPKDINPLPASDRTP